MTDKIKTVCWFMIVHLVASAGLAEPKSCLVCRFPVTQESGRSGESDACEDLFGASCMGADGKPKYSGASKKIVEELSELINETRDKSAREMGFKDFDDAVKSKLKVEGIDLIENPDQEAFRNLAMKGVDVVGGGSDSTQLFAWAERCEKNYNELQAIQYNNLRNVEALQAIVERYKSFQDRYRELAIRYYAKDIPNFLRINISEKCFRLQALNSTSRIRPRPEDNKEISNACDNFQKIKRQAIELFRAEGTADYDRRAQAFVRENMLPEFKVGSLAQSPAKSMRPTRKSKVDGLRDEISELRYASKDVCSRLGAVLENAGSKVVGDLMAMVSQSKTTIDVLVDSFYGADRKKLAMAIYSSVRSDIQDLVKGFVKEPSKRGMILDGYDSLNLFWLEKPQESTYILKDGVKYLDANKLTMGEPIGFIFSDPSLSFFKELNAFYRPQSSIGTMKIDEEINMMPGYLYALDKSPYAFLAVVAHEAGHKIGPSVSKLNGYDLAPEFRELVACYKDNKSIKLEYNQHDETIADYISSEVLARQIQKLPAEKRKQAIMSAMESFCIFDDFGNQQLSVRCKGSHPENSLRVGGVFGANPSIRKILGCEGSSSRFKTCGLKSSILDMAESGAPAQNNAEAQGDVVREGVR